MKEYLFNYISLKTQVRRLKYFSVFLENLNEKGTRIDFIQNAIIFWSESAKIDFLKLPSQTGEITRKRSNIKSSSFENYFEAIKKFELINDQNEFIIPSRIGSVFKSLQKIFNNEKLNNKYQLDRLEVIFYIYLILLKDKDYFLSILDMIDKNPSQNLESHLMKFKEFYQMRLEDKVKYVPQNEKEKIIDSLIRVKNWRSPKRYCEDIIPPRINWMLDLGILDPEAFFNNRKIVLNETGLLFLKNIKLDSFEQLDFSKNWVEENFINFFVKTFDGRHKSENWNDLNEEKKIILVNEIMDKAFVNFNVLGMPRISLEQFLLFGIMYSLLLKNTLIEQKNLQEWIGFEKILLNKKIGIRSSARQNESYVIANSI